MRRKRAGQYLTFGLVARGDIAPWDDALPEVYLTRDGDEQVLATHPAEAMGNGQFRVLLTEYETNAGSIGFVAVADGAVLTEKVVYTRD